MGDEMPIAMTIGQYGVIVVDDEGRLLWEWTRPNMRMYGLDVDPETGNFYIAMFNRIVEVTRTGRIAWQFSSPETVGLHSLQRTPEGNLLVSAAPYDKALEINKEEGVVWRWHVAEHYPVPPGYWKRMEWNYDEILSRQWTHLNHAWRLPNGDTLIGMYTGPCEDGMIVCADKNGEVHWKWGMGVTLHQHYVLPYGDEYVVCDSHNKRILMFTPEKGINSEINFDNKPLGLDIKPNGNFLVTCPDDLSLREVSPDGDTVWEGAP